MSELLQVIYAANDCQNPDFEEAQKQIITRTEETPLEVITDLLSLLQTPNALSEQKDVFIILTVITNCYRILAERGQNNLEISTILIEQSFQFFSDTYEQTRSASVNLFNVVTGYQFLLIPQLELITRLTEFLTCDNIPNLLSAMECLAKIAEDYVLGQDTRLKLVQALMDLLENFAENVIVISHVITIFTHISASIFEFFDVRYAMSFIEAIVQHLCEENLKVVIYNFIYSVATDNFAAIVPFIPIILPQTISDLTEETTSQVKLAAAFCWEGIFSDCTVSEEEVMEDVVNEIAPALIACMKHDIIGEPSLTDWEPYTAAFCTLRQILDKKNNEYAKLLHPFLLEQIFAEYTEEADQVVSARCLLLFSETVCNFPEFYGDTLERTYQILESSTSDHVLFYTLTALLFLISINDSCAEFMDHIEILLRFATDDVIGNNAIDCIYRIIVKKDFTSFELFSALHDLLSECPPQNIKNVFKCFTCVMYQHVPESIACEILQMLISNLSEAEDNYVADYICYFIKPILHRGVHDFGSLYEEAYPVLSQWYSNGVLQALSTMATFAFAAPECLEPTSEELTHLVLDALHSEEEEVWAEGANAWSFMYGRVDYGEMTEELWECIVEKADPRAPLELQEVALNALSFVFNMIETIIEAAPINIALSKYTDDGELGSIEINGREKFFDIAQVLLKLTCQMAHANVLQVTSAVAAAVLSIEDTRELLKDSFLMLAEIFDQHQSDCVNAAQVSQRIHEIYTPSE